MRTNSDVSFSLVLEAKEKVLNVTLPVHKVLKTSHLGILWLMPAIFAKKFLDSWNAQWISSDIICLGKSNYAKKSCANLVLSGKLCLGCSATTFCRSKWRGYCQPKPGVQDEGCSMYCLGWWCTLKILIHSRKAQVNNLVINSWLIIKVKWSFWGILITWGIMVFSKLRNPNNRK